MKNYNYNTEGVLSEKLFENFADNLIPVDAKEIEITQTDIEESDNCEDTIDDNINEENKKK